MACVFWIADSATSDGIFDRINAWLENLDDERKSLQPHGKAALNDSFTSLPRRISMMSLTGTERENKWFTEEKQLF